MSSPEPYGPNGDVHLAPAELVRVRGGQTSHPASPCAFAWARSPRRRAVTTLRVRRAGRRTPTRTFPRLDPLEHPLSRDRGDAGWRTKHHQPPARPKPNRRPRRSRRTNPALAKKRQARVPPVRPARAGHPWLQPLHAAEATDRNGTPWLSACARTTAPFGTVGRPNCSRSRSPRA